MVEAMRAAYEERCTRMMAYLDGMGLSYGRPGGAFYLYVNVSSTGLSATEFCETLLRDFQVLIFPGVLFGDVADRHIRIGLVQPFADIDEEAARMAKMVERYRDSRARV